MRLARSDLASLPCRGQVKLRLHAATWTSRAVSASATVLQKPRQLKPRASEQPTAVARIDVEDAIEQLTLPLRQQGAALITTTLEFPIGCVLEETSPGLISVVEVQPGGAGDAAGVQEGDIVRALTAASLQMTYPTMNLMLGGVGRPKLKRVALPATGRPFVWLREALLSNRELPGNWVTLVLERAACVTLEAAAVEPTAAATTAAGDAGSDGGGDGPIFDPRIFE